MRAAATTIAAVVALLSACSSPTAPTLTPTPVPPVCRTITIEHPQETTARYDPFCQCVRITITPAWTETREDCSR